MTTMRGTPASPLSGRTDEQLRMPEQTAALFASSLEFGDALAHTTSACLPMLGDFGFFGAVLDDGVRRAARGIHGGSIHAASLGPETGMRRHDAAQRRAAPRGHRPEGAKPDVPA